MSFLAKNAGMIGGLMLHVDGASESVDWCCCNANMYRAAKLQASVIL
jgi:hypothetical protein